MTKISVKSEHLTSVIERKIIDAGEAGVTTDKLMKDLRVGRTCIRNHLANLEADGHAYRVCRTRPHGGGHFHTFHAGRECPGAVKHAPVNRDWLVAAFFGPARQLNVLNNDAALNEQ
jgi:hypothetical protein